MKPWRDLWCQDSSPAVADDGLRHHWAVVLRRGTACPELRRRQSMVVRWRRSGAASAAAPDRVRLHWIDPGSSIRNIGPVPPRSICQLPNGDTAIGRNPRGSVRALAAPVRDGCRNHRQKAKTPLAIASSSYWLATSYFFGHRRCSFPRRRSASFVLSSSPCLCGGLVRSDVHDPPHLANCYKVARDRRPASIFFLASSTSIDLSPLPPRFLPHNPADFVPPALILLLLYIRISLNSVIPSPPSQFFPLPPNRPLPRRHRRSCGHAQGTQEERPPGRKEEEERC